MFKKIAYAVVGITLLAAPLAASAQTFSIPQLPPNPTIQDFENEIAQLTQIVTQIIAAHAAVGRGQVGGAVPSFGTPPITNVSTPSPATTASACPLIGSGIECVSGSHAVSATTYDSNNCPIQNLSCVPDTTTSVNFTASPVSGAAPLTVTFSSSQGSSINFGDGQSGTVPPPQCSQTSTIGSSPVCNPGTVTHAYASAGTYTATLGSNGGYACPLVDANSFASVLSNWTCTWQPAQTLGSQTITVTGATSPSTPAACPVYQIPLCPAGQQNQAGPVTINANGCQVPHNTCVPNTVTPTCTYGGVSTTIQTSAACQSWCLSQQTGAGTPAIGGYAPVSSVLPTSQFGAACVYMNANGVSQTIAAAPAQNANIANALTALESALQSFLSGSGK